MPKPPTSDFQSTAGSVLIKVPAGSFIMGSPEGEDGHRIWEQQREVTFGYDFFLAQTPVTQEQYEAVTGTNPTDHEQIPDAPVDSVNWEQATEYCRQLTKRDRVTGVLPDDWEYRLPTEAEWEYACRAGSSEARHGPPQDVAWYHDNADQKPHAVGLKISNAWGFHDMLGNVWEWCQDWFWVANPSRSARGGSYFNSARFCRTAQRWGWNPQSRGRYSGFRLLAAPNVPLSSEGDSDLPGDCSHSAQDGMVQIELKCAAPVDDFPQQEQPLSIYDAIDANDFDLALRVIKDDPAAIESVDGIPPPLHNCVYADKPEMLEWLLDHGADIERREQDYGATALTSAVVMRRKRIIRTLIQRRADTTLAMDHAQRGLAGAFEDDASLNREGYREIVELLQELGIGPSQ